MTTDLTTVKVSKATRVRIASAARSQHMSADQFLARLVTDWERRQRMAAVGVSVGTADKADQDSYQAEIDVWDRAIADGLDS